MCNLIKTLITGTLMVFGCTGSYALKNGQPLSKVLYPESRIQPGLTQGCFDASGYQMRLAEDGSPTFKSSPQDTNWDNRFWLPGVNGTIYATAFDGSGNLYVGGEFTAINGDTTMKYIVKWNGFFWSALGSGVNDRVNAIAVSGNDVYAGGWFTIAGGVSTKYIAKWNGSSWSTLGIGMNDGVEAIAVSDSNVYAGGYFTTAGLDSANRIAKWNGIAWSALGSGVDGGVEAIALSGSPFGPRYNWT